MCPDEVLVCDKVSYYGVWWVVFIECVDDGGGFVYDFPGVLHGEVLGCWVDIFGESVSDSGLVYQDSF